MRPFLFLIIAVTATLISADGVQSYSADPGNYPDYDHYYPQHRHEISDDTVPEDFRPEVDEVPDIIHIIPIENEDTSPDTVSSKQTSTPNTDHETLKECARQLNQPCPTGACTYEYRPVDALCDNWEKIRFPNCCVLRTEICNLHRNCKLLYKKDGPSPDTEYENWKDCARKLNKSCPKACTYEYRPVDALCDNWEKIRFPNCCALQMEICGVHRNCTLLHKKEQPVFNQY